MCSELGNSGEREIERERERERDGYRKRERDRYRKRDIGIKKERESLRERERDTHRVRQTKSGKMCHLVKHFLNMHFPPKVKKNCCIRPGTRHITHT